MSTIFRKSVGAVLSAALLATGTGVAMAAQIKLSGEQEVPPVSTSAKGSGTITVKEDKSVTGSVKTTGMTANAAHIHEGEPGTSGPVLIPLMKSGDSWSVPSGTKLSDAQYQSYQAGKLYVNVHSPKYKEGELRGQIDPSTSDAKASDTKAPGSKY